MLGNNPKWKKTERLVLVLLHEQIYLNNRTRWTEYQTWHTCLILSPIIKYFEQKGYCGQEESCSFNIILQLRKRVFKSFVFCLAKVLGSK